MALRIEKAFGPDMDHLLRMQLACDVAKSERTHGASRSSDTPRHKAEPGLAGGRAAPLDRQRAGRMVTLAGNLHILAACILACFSAILLACRNLALARKMGTLLRFLIFHKKLLGTPDMRFRLHSCVCGC